MKERGHYAGEEVENNEPLVTHGIFHIVTEYPEVEHISDKVDHPAMEKHG